MASIPMVMQRLRRTRRESKRPPSIGRFQQYSREYEEILRAVEGAGGEPALDEVAGWMLEWTARQERLPAPATVRRRAREVLRERGVEVPAGSVLSG